MFYNTPIRFWTAFGCATISSVFFFLSCISNMSALRARHLSSPIVPRDIRSLPSKEWASTVYLSPDSISSGSGPIPSSYPLSSPGEDPRCPSLSIWLSSLLYSAGLKRFSGFVSLAFTWDLSGRRTRTLRLMSSATSSVRGTRLVSIQLGC